LSPSLRRSPSLRSPKSKRGDALRIGAYRTITRVHGLKGELARFNGRLIPNADIAPVKSLGMANDGQYTSYEVQLSPRVSVQLPLRYLMAMIDMNSTDDSWQSILQQDEENSADLSTLNNRSDVMATVDKVCHQLHGLVDQTDVNGVEQLFRGMDSDCNGQIDKAEFLHHCGKVGLAISAREIEMIWPIFDTSGDGVVDLDEFAHFMESRRSGRKTSIDLKVLSKETRQLRVAKKSMHLKALRDLNTYLQNVILSFMRQNNLTEAEIFADFDLDGNGDIDKNELWLGLRRVGVDVDLEMINGIWPLLSLDINGKITVQEWSRFLAGREASFKFSLDRFLANMSDDTLAKYATLNESNTSPLKVPGVPVTGGTRRITNLHLTRGVYTGGSGTPPRSVVRHDFGGDHDVEAAREGTAESNKPEKRAQREPNGLLLHARAEKHRHNKRCERERRATLLQNSPRKQQVTQCPTAAVASPPKGNRSSMQSPRPRPYTAPERTTLPRPAPFREPLLNKVELKPELEALRIAKLEFVQAGYLASNPVSGEEMREAFLGAISHSRMKTRIQDRGWGEDSSLPDVSAANFVAIREALKRHGPDWVLFQRHLLVFKVQERHKAHDQLASMCVDGDRAGLTAQNARAAAYFRPGETLVVYWARVHRTAYLAHALLTMPTNGSRHTFSKKKHALAKLLGPQSPATGAAEPPVITTTEPDAPGELEPPADAPPVAVEPAAPNAPDERSEIRSLGAEVDGAAVAEHLAVTEVEVKAAAKAQAKAKAEAEAAHERNAKTAAEARADFEAKTAGEHSAAAQAEVKAAAGARAKAEMQAAHETKAAKTNTAASGGS
jgi:Ca2+-binding EF-hand superfamily protein